MQQELAAENLPVPLQILGVNQAGADGTNGSANVTVCTDRDLPWLQETETDSVWADWEVIYRDVIVLDKENRPIEVFNLSDNNLDNPNVYETLKGILRTAAGG